MSDPQVDPSKPAPRRGSGKLIAAGLALAAVAALAVFLLRRQPQGPPVPPEPTPEVQTVLAEVQKKFDAKQYEAGISLARDYLAKHPDAAYVHFTIGTLLGALSTHGKPTT